MTSNKKPLLNRLFPAKRRQEAERLSPRMRKDVGLPPKYSTDLPKLFWL